MLARCVGLAYAGGIFLQFLNNNMIHENHTQAVALCAGTGYLLFVICTPGRKGSLPCQEQEDGYTIAGQSQEGAGQKDIQYPVYVGIMLIGIVFLQTIVFTTLDNAVTAVHASGDVDISYHSAKPKFWAGLGRAVNNVCALMIMTLAGGFTSVRYEVMIVAVILFFLISVLAFSYQNILIGMELRSMEAVASALMPQTGGAADNVTVPENTTVTVTLFPRDGYTVQLVVNGNQVTLNNNVYTVETSANQPELKFEACFTNPGGGNNSGNPNPPAGNQPICLILEGDAFKGADDTDYYHYMKS